MSCSSLFLRRLSPLCDDLCRALSLTLFAVALVYPFLFFWGTAASILLFCVVIWRNIHRGVSSFWYGFFIDGIPLAFASMACLRRLFYAAPPIAYHVFLILALVYLVALLLPVKREKSRYLFHFIAIFLLSLGVVLYYRLFTNVAVPYNCIVMVALSILLIYTLLRIVFLFMYTCLSSPPEGTFKDEIPKGEVPVSVFLRCVHQGCYWQIIEDSTWKIDLQPTESPSQAVNRMLASLSMKFRYLPHYQYSKFDEQRMVHYYYLIVKDITPLITLYPGGVWVALPENTLSHA